MTNKHLNKQLTNKQMKITFYDNKNGVTIHITPTLVLDFNCCTDEYINTTINDFLRDEDLTKSVLWSSYKDSPLHYTSKDYYLEADGFATFL